LTPSLRGRIKYRTQCAGKQRRTRSCLWQEAISEPVSCRRPVRLRLANLAFGEASSALRAKNRCLLNADENHVVRQRLPVLREEYQLQVPRCRLQEKKAGCSFRESRSAGRTVLRSDATRPGYSFLVRDSVMLNMRSLLECSPRRRWSRRHPSQEGI